MWKRAALTVSLVVLLVVILETASRLALLLIRPFVHEDVRPTAEIYREQSERIRVLIAHDSTRLLAFDSILGWRYRSDHRDSINQTNGEALRSVREYSQRPGPGVLRVAAFGNSFVYGNEVANETSWARQVELVAPRIEVLNYGVGGYGLDQAYLRFLREGMRYGPQVVLIGFSPDDLGRVVNVYRRFRSNREIPLVKPRYLLEPSGNLELVPAPFHDISDYDRYLANPALVRELGRYDQWYEPLEYEDPLYDYSATVRLLTTTWITLRRRYLGAETLIKGDVFNPASSAFRIQVALFHRFVDAARAAGARPVVLLLPDRECVERSRNGRRPVLASLSNALAAAGIEYFDATDAFRTIQPAPNVAAWFMPGGHYSPLGNEVVARWLVKRLEAQSVQR
ncbi:MAG TPA: hypothetical protein VLT79_07545 [Gemmatimonadales bacterium]|nr:hypothetical protein [Gemmatimonadales bacterium]